jgi:uncharacterized phiE125 gp8 family phage protein
MSLELVTAPGKETVLLSHAKAWLRVEHTDDDTLITGLIASARVRAESETARAFITQTWDLKLDAFSDSIPLPLPPVQSVTSIKYIDTDGAEQSFTDFVLTQCKGITYIVLAYEKSWPAIRSVPDAITIRFVAGYGDDPGDVPEPIKSAIKVTVADYYENRESIVIGTSAVEINSIAAKNLLSFYRVNLYA